jgi:hypothetical protein
LNSVYEKFDTNLFPIPEKVRNQSVSEKGQLFEKMGKTRVDYAPTISKSVKPRGVLLDAAFLAAIEKAQNSYRHAPDPLTGREKGHHGSGSEGSHSQDSDEPEKEERLSYAALMEFIAQNHPTNPITKEKFSLLERLTVKDFGYKIFDCLGCYQIKEFCQSCCRSIRKIELRGTNPRVKKPEILDDVPETDSEESSEGDDEKYAGLSAAGSHMGTGAVLYFQMMKGFAMLFAILSVVNIPIFMILGDATLHNRYYDLNESFRYLTIGNLGQDNDICDSIPVKFGADGVGKHGELHFKCQEEDSYMT